MISIEKARKVVNKNIDHITHRSVKGCKICESVLNEHKRMFEDERRSDRNFRSSVEKYMEKYYRGKG